MLRHPALFLFLLGLPACGGLTGPAAGGFTGSGTIGVQVTTAGSGPDSNGYILQVDGMANPGLRLGQTDSLTLDSVSAGEFCPVAGAAR